MKCNCIEFHFHEHLINSTIHDLVTQLDKEFQEERIRHFDESKTIEEEGIKAGDTIIFCAKFPEGSNGDENGVAEIEQGIGNGE